MAKRGFYQPYKKHRPKFHLSSGLIVFIAVILIASVAYCTNRAKRDNRRMHEQIAKCRDSELVEVKGRTFDDAEMLHYPGFDIYYSNEHRQPYYVAWSLSPEQVRTVNVTRSDNFRPDPSVAAGSDLSDYRRSGYDRGHMAPAADFRFSQEAQESTFLLSNISPQHHDLNTGAWKNLEDQCRNWAERDSTIYIVCGPILTDYLDRSIGRNKVTVPMRYFKVVLAPYADPPRAIGFIMPNTRVDGGVQASAVTVDQVEEITGYDFFSSLPDDIENMVESHAKYSEWQYSKRKSNKQKK